MGYNYDDYDDGNENGDRTPGFVRGSDTSEHAARNIDPTARRGCVARIFALFANGATYTRDEIVAALGLRGYSSTTPRVGELCDGEMLVETGETRLTSRGQPAKVLRMVPGASMEMYVTYLRNRRIRDAPKIKYKKWLATLGAAGLVYAKSPTSDNLTAMGVVAKTAPKDPPAPTPDDQEANEEDIMEWSRRGS